MKQTIDFLFCDWHDDGVTEGQTVPFEIGTVKYELDLCADCRTELKAGARRVTKPKRRAAARKTSRRKVAAPATSNGNGHLPSSKEVREWAAQQKIAVSDKGRVPNDVVAQYEAANAS